MKASARSILSAITAIGLTAFTTISAFSSHASASVTATALGLLAIYGMVEMMILSYSPRRFVPSTASVRVVAMPSAPVEVAAIVTFPVNRPHRCAA